jgi:hypothetical protein
MMGELAPLGPDEPTQATELRASYADRDAVIEKLRVAAGDGRLTAEELDERLELAFNAKTYGELATLTSDLPVSGESGDAVAVPVKPKDPKDMVRINCTSGHAAREGRWVVPRRMEVKVTSGSVKLDLTDAIITHHVLDIAAEVRSGHLRLITKPGIAIDADEVAVRSGNVKIKAPWGAGVPVTLQVNISGRVGSGNILARPRRRNFWQWLARRPMPYAIAAR